MSRPRILLLESIHPVADALLEADGFEVLRADGALNEDQLVARLPGVQVLGIRSKTQVTRRVLEAADSLIAVGAFCIGTNQIALDHAMARGVAVFNAPFSNTRSVAELVLAEIVMLSRGLGDRIREMHQGVWKKASAGTREVRGKTLGVVGYGHIGSQISILGEALGMKVVFHDIIARLPLGNSQPVRTLDALLQQSDFVTLHVPETPQTKGLIGAAQLARMKPGACLINASRGTVVDLEALAQALREKRLGGAAIDVYPDEPESNSSEGFATPLRGLPNVILTPHIAGTTLEAQEAIGREVSTSLIKYINAGATRNANAAMINANGKPNQTHSSTGSTKPRTPITIPKPIGSQICHRRACSRRLHRRASDRVSVKLTVSTSRDLRAELSVVQQR